MKRARGTRQRKTERSPGTRTLAAGRIAELEAQLAEALEQQTATAEILRVISSSPTDLQPVMNAIAENAGRVCAAADAVIYRVEGDSLRIVATYGSIPKPVIGSAESLRPIARDWVTGRAVVDRETVHVPDLANATDGEFPLGRAIARRFGHRTTLATPLMREGVPVGAILIRRTEVRPFSEKQITLLQTFADQAVIAIENVRLFSELQENNRVVTAAHAQVAEALEQQTATAEILRVISSSPTDLQPVFDTIAASATRLCDALYSLVFRFDGETVTLVAYDGAAPKQLQVIRSAYPARPGRRSVAAQAILERRVIAIADAQSGTEYPHVAERAKAIGYRSIVSVPMMRGDTAIGAINVVRVEALPFSDTQIELLKTFADQAVIAIENVRLFTELQQKNQALTQAHAQVSESLEQQTATSEILRVISASPTDVRPVMDAIAENAAQLCGEGDASRATSTVWQLEGSSMRIVASYGVPRSTSQAPPGWLSIDVLPLNRGFISGRAVVDRQIVHLRDLAAEGDDFAEVKAAQLPQGTRTMLGVPLLREGNALGAIVIRRFEVRPFTDKQIALVKTFADQAVIAIENARLFTELQASNRELTAALDTQTATSGILRVISRSQTDVQPVFNAIVVSAVRLLGAYSGVLTRIVGDQIELAALTSTDDAGDAALRARYPLSLQSEELPAQAIRDRAPINIGDAHTDPRWSEAKHAEARIRGSRSQVVVPMLHHDEAIGLIGVSRREPGGFTDAEIALLKTFADQAVIAIENVRLFTELQERTAALTRSVGQLTALGEVGQAVSSSLELSTVLTTIVGRAVQLCGATGGAIYEYDERAEEFYLRAIEGLSEEYLELARQTPQRKGEGATGRLALTPESIEVPDITSPGAYEGRLKEILVRTGYRGLLAVPLLREGHVLGSLVVLRTTPGSFGPDVVSLLQTFATQSALALQNARLFREIEVKSREVAAASQHKSEFLANMSHELRTPLNAIIGYSEMLQEEAQDRQQDAFIPDLERINAAAKHQLELINDILDLVQGRSGEDGTRAGGLPPVHGHRQRADPRPGASRAARNHAAGDGGPATRRRAGGRAEDQAGRAESAIERHQVHAGGGPDRRPGPPCGGWRGGLGQRYRGRHRAGGPGRCLRGVPSGGGQRGEAGGHRAGAHLVPEVRRASRRKDLGQEPGGRRLYVRVHDTCRDR